MGSGMPQADQEFIMHLTGASSAEIHEYAAEIMSNRVFHDRVEEKRRKLHGNQLDAWRINIGGRLGAVLYVLCRKLRPDAIVETGVAAGVSSAYFLCALEENKHGKLYSIDLPWEGLLPNASPEAQSGWIVPDYLRKRWQLILGRSAEKLLPLLGSLGEIDVFLHDSEHSYQNMFWEYETAWAHLKRGGLLLSHNIDMTSAFPDFCLKVGATGFVLTNLGGAVRSAMKGTSEPTGKSAPDALLPI